MENCDLDLIYSFCCGYQTGSVVAGICSSTACGGEENANSGICLDTSKGKVSLGRFNQDLEKLGEGAKLTYKDGGRCTDDPKNSFAKYSSEITFMCPPDNQNDGSLHLQGYADCTYLFHYYSQAMCSAPAIECEYVTPDGKSTYDLSRLVQEDQRNYMISDQATGDTYHINVCHPLTRVQGCRTFDHMSYYYTVVSHTNSV